MNVWLLVFFLLLIHVGLTNAFEKLLTQQWFGSLRRPCLSCKELDTFACLGMPSGHAETVVVVISMLVLRNVISIPVGLVVVLAVCLQRVIAYRHTVKQVLVGGTLGLAYAGLYYLLRKDQYILAVSVAISITMLLLIVMIVDKKVHEPFPTWVDPSLYKSMYKKQASHLPNKICHVLSVLARPSFALFCSWSQLEKHLDTIVESVRHQNIDAVVGIKTGGAIITKYVAEKLGLPYHYIKTSADIWKCDKKAINTFQDVVEKVLLKKKRRYIICEPIDVDLRGKNILVLDELIYSGVTLTSVRDYLLEDKGVNSVKLATVVIYEPKETYVAKGLDILTATANKYFIWPWGFDN